MVRPIASFSRDVKLSDNGPSTRRRPRCSTITTPAYSPESDGLAEAYIGTFSRDYVDGAELRDAETVLAQLEGWLDDYNTQAPPLGTRDAELARVPGRS